MKLPQKLDLFKIAIVTILSIFLYLFNQYSKNGRYEACGDDQVIDTRTGNLFDTELSRYSVPIFLKPKIPQNLK